MGVATWSLSDPSWGICQAVVVLGAWSDGGQAGDCHWGACCKMREAAQETYRCMGNPAPRQEACGQENFKVWVFSFLLV